MSGPRSTRSIYCNSDSRISGYENDTFVHVDLQSHFATGWILAFGYHCKKRRCTVIPSPNLSPLRQSCVLNQTSDECGYHKQVTVPDSVVTKSKCMVRFLLICPRVFTTIHSCSPRRVCPFFVKLPPIFISRALVQSDGFKRLSLPQPAFFISIFGSRSWHSLILLTTVLWPRREVYHNTKDLHLFTRIPRSLATTSM